MINYDYITSNALYRYGNIYILIYNIDFILTKYMRTIIT